MPEVKIRKAVRAMRARSVLNSALLRSNLPDSHFQTGGIATDNNAANIQIFLCLQQFLHIFPANHQHCYPRTKVEVLIKQGVVLFGTYYREGTDVKTHLSTAITTKWKDSETVVRLRF